MQSLEQNIQDLAVELLGDNFKFRPHQLEAVKSIVENVMSDTKHTVLEAPTGSGKSIIGMLAAYALHKLFNKSSYILVSDLSLYDQYENDIIKTGSNAFGCIKGKENYICWMNGCKASQSLCSLHNMSPIKLMSGARGAWQFPCKDKCKYMQDYVKAVVSPITLMTYQMYFIQRNYVEDILFGGHNTNFPARDLVICDECHKICDICQSHFAPRISIERPIWMNILCKYMHMAYDEHDRSTLVDAMLSCSNNDELVDYVASYASLTSKYAEANECIRSTLSKKRNLSKQDKAALFAGNIARQEQCKFTDMLNFIASFGSTEYVAKTVSKEDITLNFVFDNVMLDKYMHNKSKCELLMSATVGDFDEYAKLAGLDVSSFKHIAIPSTFDFSKSPVILSTKNRMSYAEKDVSIKSIAEQVTNICHANAHMRGIIQTGSYANSDALKLLLPDDVLSRCLFYKGTGEKNYMLEEFLDLEEDDNRILVGPTLIEGLNFPDSMCRFQICIKVPYAFLGSEYVCKKMKYVNGWYEYDVLNKICQGIGRGVRHEKDWCETYILDGCIMNLARRLNSISTLHGRLRKIV